MWRFLDGVNEPPQKKAKTKQELLDVQRQYEKDKRKRTFQESWVNEFSWLQCDSSAGMICTVCKKYESVGSFVTGCTNFKVYNLNITHHFVRDS